MGLGKKTREAKCHFQYILLKVHTIHMVITVYANFWLLDFSTAKFSFFLFVYYTTWEESPCTDI